jgi:hypothetical protein
MENNAESGINTRMNKDTEQRRKMESKLSDHKQHKKKLDPPFVQIGMIGKSSWIDQRLPEMLWACLIAGNIERDKALDFFRHVLKYIDKNPEFHNVSLTGISLLPKEKRLDFTVSEFQSF